MINLQQKMKMIEVERQDVRMSIEKLNEELDKLTRTAPSSSEQLDAYEFFGELPQPNLEVKRNKTTNIAAYPISQAPRFMRPTICSRRKSGSEHLTSEEKVRFPARRKRPMNHHAKSVNFPVKSTSENNSECSISRNSCLVALTVKSSADLETEYSQDLSECDIKEDVFPEQKVSPKCSNHHRVHSEGCENGIKSNTYCAEYLNVDKWLLLNKNAPATSSHSHRNKRVLAIPAPKKKHICNGQKGRDNFQDEKFHKYKFAMKQIVNQNKLEKHADVEGSRSMQEVAVSKPPTNLKNYDNIDTRSTSDSPSYEIVEERTINIKDKLDDVSIEKHIRSTIYPPDIWCSSFHSKQDDNGVNTLSTMQALLGEKESSDRSLSNSRDCWCQISIPSSANSILDAREDSGISISRIELHSCCQQLPTAICGEDCEKEGLDTSFQSSAEGIRPGLLKMRSQRALFVENVAPHEPIEPQQLIKSQENVMNSGKKDSYAYTRD